MSVPINLSIVKSKRFTTLDGLRGLAALLVMCFHADPVSPLKASGGYLAVDIFFILSGFVLALTYESRLHDGLCAKRFFLLRLARLYPMYLVGMLFSLMLGPIAANSLLMIPNLHFNGTLFPDNIPMWSLFYELLVSLVFGLIAVRTGSRGLGWILAVSGGVLLIQTLGLGKSMVRGPDWPDLPIGLTRTAFSFALGVALCRFHNRSKNLRHVTWWAVLPFILLFAVLMAAPAERQLWDMTCVFIILPSIVWMGTIWEMPLPKLGAALGDISYPLYCIHAPILWSGQHGLPNMATLMAGIILIAWSLDRWVDRPMRLVVKQALAARSSLPSPA
jgi:peptidoglycan/LPS O-acetylase OafA/YrhL